MILQWMRDKGRQQLSLSRAMFQIFLTTLIVSGTATLGWLYYLHILHKRAQDDDYIIRSIVQTGPEAEVLNTSYLAEVLDIASDVPQNLYAFDLAAARQRLLRSPLIKDVHLRRIRPGTLYVDYLVRKPVALVGDYSNTGIDAEGYPVPLAPFFSPKRLPKIYLGLEPFGEGSPNSAEWGKPLSVVNLGLAMELITLFARASPFRTTTLTAVDVSQAYATSSGHRELVISVEETVLLEGSSPTGPRVRTLLLRLGTENYLQGLANYTVLREHLHKQDAIEGAPPTVVDLRLGHLAFYK